MPEAQQMRCTMTTGPMGDDEGLEIGRQVRYRQAAVERWLTGTIPAGSPEEYR
jgi:hypothetical protein